MAQMLRCLVHACRRGLEKSPLDSFAPSYLASQPHSWNPLLQPADPTSLTFQRSKYTYNFKRTAGVAGLKFWAPITPGLRHKISIDYAALGVYTGEPVPALSHRANNTGGRNMLGRITCRHRGGGDLRVLRTVDFLRSDLDGVPGVVERLEADPGRSGFLALVRYEPVGQLPVYRYQLAAGSIQAGDILMAGPGAPIRPGSTLPLQDIPLGLPIHNIELRPGKGGQLVRAAATSATINIKEDRFATVILPSGEKRLLPLTCRATVGKVSNHLQQFINLGKAGAKRKLGFRPSVRGIAMNPVDHPHGGRANGGRPSCSPWGIYTKGQRTRHRNKYSNRFIITRAGGCPIDKFVQAKKWRAAAAKALKAQRQSQSGANKPVAPVTIAATLKKAMAVPKTVAA